MLLKLRELRSGGWRKVRRRVWVPLLLLLAAWGCSHTTRDRLMHFFFEIPDRGATEAQADNVADAQAPPAPARSPLAPIVERRYRSVHAPVVARNCQVCHDVQRRMDAPAEWMMVSCRSCHSRYFGDEVGHAPVAYRYCSGCHTPHRSEQPHLLTAPVFDVCMACHPRPENLSRKDHSGPDVESCTKCHDPHFGEGMLLR